MVGVALLADEVVVVSLDDVELGTGTTTMGPSVEAADVLDVMAVDSVDADEVEGVTLGEASDVVSGVGELVTGAVELGAGGVSGEGVAVGSGACVSDTPAGIGAPSSLHLLMTAFTTSASYASPQSGFALAQSRMPA